MWEIYIGDLIGAVQITDKITSIANTKYGIKISDASFTVHWNNQKVGQITVAKFGTSLGIGKLKIDELHRGTGIVRVLMLAIYVYGTLNNCTTIEFNDEFASTVKSPSQLIAFWSSVGMGAEGQKVPIRQAMTTLFAKQGQFAIDKGLAYTPNTVLLNPSPVIPAFQAPTGGGKTLKRSASFGS
jgi:hypothetical protein